MQRIYTVTGDSVELKYGQVEEKADLPNFMAELGRVAPFHTGLMPPGVRSWSQMGEYTQILLETPPGINLTYWGQYESDRRASLLELAQPYRVILATFKMGVLQGARMFYSPIPITSSTQQLYHVNVPNSNCRGYGGNGVGWLCLYHRNLVPAHRPWGEKIQQVLERASGAEAYNDNNMSGTDGTRFYQQHRPNQKFLWDKNVWEKKSQDEGWEWTLNPDLWIPIKVASINEQGKHVSTGIPLTVGVLLEGGAAEYYVGRGGDASVKSHQKMRQGESPSTVMQETFDIAWGRRGQAGYGIDARHAVKTELQSIAAENVDGMSACGRCAKITKHLHTVGNKKFQLCQECHSKNSYCNTCDRIKQTRYFHTDDKCKRCEKSERAAQSV